MDGERAVVTKAEFLKTWIDGDLKKWLGDGPRRVEDFAFSVEEWGAMTYGIERRKRLADEAARTDA